VVYRPNKKNKKKGYSPVKQSSFLVVCFIESNSINYDHKDVVMVEATGEDRKGKDANRKFEVEFMGMMKEMHGGGVRSITSNEKEATTMVESWMDVTMKDGRRNMMEEVAVQKWKGDQIIHERFYYNMGK
jgi:ketosteroid isomerase-like protein